MTIEDFKNQYNISEIVTEFEKISIDILNKIPNDKWVWMLEEYGDGDNCKTRAFEIYPVSEENLIYQELFVDVNHHIEKIKDCVQTYVIYVEPNSTIPKHRDDDDSFRIVTAVNEIKESWLEAGGNKIYFKKIKVSDLELI